MSRTVFKYPIPMADEFTIDMPSGAQMLCVQVQNDQPRLWARVDDDPGVTVVKERFRLAGTGHPNVDGRYVGTFQLHGGQLVFHLFSLGTLARPLDCVPPSKDQKE